MANLSNSKIELIAVGAVEWEANKPSSNLVPNITKGDKGVSFDGEIELFIDDSQTVESRYGSVTVQVKGTQVQNFTEGNRKFPLKLAHYRNFYSASGVLLLVVEVKADGSTKIFYKQLLPKELYSIIKICERKGKKSKSVELRPLSETNLDTVCFRFLQEQKHQPPILVENKPLQQRKYEEYNIRSLTFNPSASHLSNIFDHDFVIYGKMDTLEVPLYITKFDALSTESNEKIDVDGVIYDLSTKTIIQDGKYIWVFEDAFTVALDPKTGVINIQQNDFCSLNVQLKVIPFILALLNGKKIDIRGSDFGVTDKSPVLKNYLKNIQNLYKLILDLEKVFDIFCIDKNRIIREEESKIRLIDGFEFLVRATLYNDLKGLTLEKPDRSCIVNLCIGDLTIVCFYKAESKALVNIFSDNLYTKPILLKTHDGTESCQHSFYIFMNDESFKYGENINYDYIKRSFDSFDPFINTLAFGRTLEFCLNCINSFDQSGKLEVLHLAEYILDKYNEVPEVDLYTRDDLIIKVNQLQIKKRISGYISSIDIDLLIDLKRKFPSDEFEIHFCINVILDGKTEAQRMFEKLDKERSDYYKTLPIYNLYTKM
ncbi:hypothetical protein M2277_005642 [Paenibacillus sp. LBL]|uniref:DUF4365 domain-containing protein n=1 Tax=Paenibacillus sp. LBL TaxID=2940563 RepID=UPI0024759D60|nr:DUF4365 domain-containing protein [Paenibacillus sp. LBL]MDH6674943.1 hypothetical protein [Paenibacillus sp. LBL]